MTSQVSDSRDVCGTKEACLDEETSSFVAADGGSHCGIYWRFTSRALGVFLRQINKVTFASVVYFLSPRQLQSEQSQWSMREYNLPLAFSLVLKLTVEFVMR